MNFSNRGITLIEIFVVIAITAIVLAIAIPNFSKYVKKYGVEKEITEIYGDLVEQRFKSMSSGVPHGIRFDSATQYTLFEFDDKNYNMVFDGVGEEKNSVQKSGLKFDLICPVWNADNSIVMFDEKGVYRNKKWGGTGITIRIDSPARYNCIKVFSTRIKMGELKRYRVTLKCLEGEISAKDASFLLGLSYRQFLRIKKEVKERGIKGVIRKTGSGKPSTPDSIRKEIERLKAWGRIFTFDIFS